ncbi:class I SAM-dependent methyltransferase [Vibrio sp. YMD68]|uniref:class I SAM-dependent methyltransferase n=1 Tax=Vibrio sp. YMD68 TaxID=3042300 RepID=UPI00249A5843|nr:class I SAM-dependent methyltransferase [Vibrio sp. YMD68]WGV98666.1 class I SAM-dependent methyltransferase [Vibrio sp. YMD68]
MHFLDRLRIYFYHRNRIKNWAGDNSKIQGWTSIESQHNRFKIIQQACEFHNKYIVDLGCGYGELFDYLTQHHTLGRYTGVDQQPQFLAQAKKRLAKQRDVCEFVHGDISKFTADNADIVIASGSLNYHSREPDYLTRIISHMYLMANEAIIFNLLDSSTFPKQPFLTGYNKQGIVRYCKTLCANVELIDGYDQRDFTIVMKKSIDNDSK